jgi:hypothetical protein
MAAAAASLAGPGSCGQNLKKLEIYDIIKC